MLQFIVVVCCLFVGASVAAPNCGQPPKKEDMMDCCKKPPTLNDVGIKCAEKYPMDGEINFCHGECVFNATGLLVNGQIQSDKAVGILTEMLKDAPEYLAVAKAAFPKCEGLAKTYLPKMMEKKPEAAEKCNPLPSLVAACFFAETMINCPASIWQNRDSCNEAKEYMKNCAMGRKD